jgi:hypothetical protein
MPIKYVECYPKHTQRDKEHNISVISTLLEGDEAFYKAVVNYARSARRDAPWQ